MDQQHASRALKAVGLIDARGVVTPGADDVGGLKAREISELRRTAKWRLLKRSKRRMIFSLEKH